MNRATNVTDVVTASNDEAMAAASGSPTTSHGSTTAAQIAITDQQRLDRVRAAEERMRQLAAPDAAIAVAVRRLFDSGPHAYDDAA